MPHDGSPPLISPPVERLEDRRMLSSATRTGDTLRVYGDAGVDNVITVGYADRGRDNILVTINGTPTTIRAEDVKNVRIFGDTGNDRVTIDSSVTGFRIRTSVFGSSGDDVIRCGNENDYVEGGSGDDRISLGNGRNFGFGYKGNDVIDGGAQRDFVSGGNSGDTITGGGGRDQLQGDNGSDLVYGGYVDQALNDIEESDHSDNDNATNTPEPDGSDLIFGGRGDDTIYGQNAKDVIFGQDGNDLIDGGKDKDEIFGMDGDDSLTAGGGDDSIWGGHGVDVIHGGQETHAGEFKDIDKFVDELIPPIG